MDGGGNSDDDTLWLDLCAAAERNTTAPYDARLVHHLLRLVRNTSSGASGGGGHYQELPPRLREALEAREGGIAGFVLRRFPGLALAVWRTEQELAAKGGGGGSVS